MKVSSNRWLELLITLGIIVGLSMLSPSFWHMHEAPTRSRVSRTKSDLRTIAVALDAYLAKQGSYPSTRIQDNVPSLPLSMMVPWGEKEIAAAALRDPFLPRGKAGGYAYLRHGENRLLVGRGPDEKFNIPLRANADLNGERLSALCYDPTNGLKSEGDLFRVAGAE